ncbi:MAG: hypothetical protein AB4352_21095 [Hormoscilla sp.]
MARLEERQGDRMAIENGEERMANGLRKKLNIHDNNILGST